MTVYNRTFGQSRRNGPKNMAAPPCQPPRKPPTAADFVFCCVGNDDDLIAP